MFRQFLTVDPTVSFTHQPHGYASNDPLLATDPCGLWTIDDGLDWVAGGFLHGPGANALSLVNGFHDDLTWGETSE